MNTPMISPNIVVCESGPDAARHVADLLASEIRTKPDMVIGLATGGTPVDVYRELIRQHREADLDCSRVTSFNLDEYVGLPSGHPQSYRYFMQQHLFDDANFSPAKTHVPDGMAADLDQYAKQYEQLITQSGGIDLQLLGIGNNGHIAFNEPGSLMESRTRVVELAEETIDANARFFESTDQVPRRAITMGIGTILEARKIVLMATGESKAGAIAEAFAGVCHPSNPASALQRHANVVVVLDPPAASRLGS
ncbi:MAG: glucosamine-6-phosphate deaminase [Rubripirellula sp.]|nr:glucosamine-6-phosphate deaminase [Rubripirellula sp.]